MSWKKDSGYIGSPASAQTLAVFQCTEPNNDYPPHFMRHLSTHSLDQKSYKDLDVILLSFPCSRSTDRAALHLLECVQALCFQQCSVNYSKRYVRLSHTRASKYRFLPFPYISQVWLPMPLLDVMPYQLVTAAFLAFLMVRVYSLVISADSATTIGV